MNKMSSALFSIPFAFSSILPSFVIFINIFLTYHHSNLFKSKLTSLFPVLEDLTNDSKFFSCFDDLETHSNLIFIYYAGLLQRVYIINDNKEIEEGNGISSNSSTNQRHKDELCQSKNR